MKKYLYIGILILGIGIFPHFSFAQSFTANYCGSNYATGNCSSSPAGANYAYVNFANPPLSSSTLITFSCPNPTLVNAFGSTSTTLFAVSQGWNGDIASTSYYMPVSEIASGTYSALINASSAFNFQTADLQFLWINNSSGGELSCNNADITINWQNNDGLPFVQFVAPPTPGGLTAPIQWLNAQVGNLTSTDQYAINENTIYTVANLLGGSSNNIPGFGQTNTGAFFTRFGYTTGFSYPTVGVPNGENISMVSTVTVLDLTTGNYISLPVASDTIQWNMIPVLDASQGLNLLNGTSTILNNQPIWTQATSTAPVTTPWDGTVSTSTASSSIITTSASSSLACAQWNVPSSGIFDIGDGMLYAGCQLINYLVVPSPTAITSLQQDINQFTGQNGAIGIFPFSIFFGITSDYQQGLLNASTTINPDLVLNIQGLNGQPITLLTLTSSTAVQMFTATGTTPDRFAPSGTLPACNTSCATNTVNNLWLPIRFSIWGLTGISAIIIIGL